MEEIISEEEKRPDNNVGSIITGAADKDVLAQINIAPLTRIVKISLCRLAIQRILVPTLLMTKSAFL